MKNILVAHYKRDLGWINRINKDFNVIIYSTSDPNYNYVKNKGMDASMYLKYIIDNYYNLPDKTLFVHHHEMDWTQDYDLPFIINNLNWECDDYFSICARKYYGDLFFHYPQHKIDMKNIWNIFSGYLDFPDCLFYYAGTQFCADKKVLLQYPIEFWVNLFNWVMTVSLPDGFVGRVFEWSWHYILTKNPKEKQRNIEEIINFKK